MACLKSVLVAPFSRKSATTFTRHERHTQLHQLWRSTRFIMSTNATTVDIKEEKLFRQPPASNCEGDCPICFIPLPIDRTLSSMNSCCGKVICDGCTYAADEHGLGNRCVYCRTETPANEHEFEQNIKKRIKANDPPAITQWGIRSYCEGNYRQALEYFTKAAELGDFEAHYI